MINLKGLVSRFLRTRMLGNFLLDWGRTRDGGVAVTVAVMTPVLVGVLAIAIDFGRTTNLSTELNNAADAYALAGATQLDQSPGSCVRAMQAAINVNLVNTETFASNPSGSDVYIDPTLNPFGNSNIRFMERINKDPNGDIIGDYIDVLYSAIADCDANAQHIEVFIDQDPQGDPYRVGYSFAGIIGAATETFPKGYAIAEAADLTCGFVPMMICPVDPPGAPASANAQEWYDNNIVSYKYMGMAGNPYGPDVWPLTTVSIRGMQFEFSTPLIGAVLPFEFPKCSASLIGEDYRTCPNGYSQPPCT